MLTANDANMHCELRQIQFSKKGFKNRQSVKTAGKQFQQEIRTRNSAIADKSRDAFVHLRSSEPTWIDR